MASDARRENSGTDHSTSHGTGSGLLQLTRIGGAGGQAEKPFYHLAYKKIHVPEAWQVCRTAILRRHGRHWTSTLNLAVETFLSFKFFALINQGSAMDMDNGDL